MRTKRIRLTKKFLKWGLETHPIILESNRTRWYVDGTPTDDGEYLKGIPYLDTNSGRIYLNRIPNFILIGSNTDKVKSLYEEYKAHIFNQDVKKVLV